MPIKRYFRVSGRVQGVFYRASTQKKAESLGLSGWVRNLDCGDVELEVQGNAKSVDELAEWLRVGPENARVDDVHMMDLEPDPGLASPSKQIFSVRY